MMENKNWNFWQFQNKKWSWSTWKNLFFWNPPQNYYKFWREEGSIYLNGNQIITEVPWTLGFWRKRWEGLKYVVWVLRGGKIKWTANIGWARAIVNANAVTHLEFK